MCEDVQGVPFIGAKIPKQQWLAHQLMQERGGLRGCQRWRAGVMALTG
jgi:hypothetical protein